MGRVVPAGLPTCNKHTDRIGRCQMDWTALKKFVPPNVAWKIPYDNPAIPLNGRDVYKALSPHKVIVMACNIRIPSVIPGIMKAAQELNAVVAFELAKTEGNIDSGYTSMTPEIFANTILTFACKEQFAHPFVIHGDQSRSRTHRLRRSRTQGR